MLYLVQTVKDNQYDSVTYKCETYAEFENLDRIIWKYLDDGVFVSISVVDELE